MGWLWVYHWSLFRLLGWKTRNITTSTFCTVSRYLQVSIIISVFVRSQMFGFSYVVGYFLRTT
jgi:hypothetical protein